MAAPLSVCTKEDRRSVILILWSEAVSGAQSIKDFRHISRTVYCRNGVSTNGFEKLKKWSHKCYAWQMSRTTVYCHHWRQHWGCTWHDSVRQTSDEVAHFLQTSYGSVYEMMHNKLGFYEVCARWVPNQVTEVHKQTLVDDYQKYLDRYGNERDIFLDRIITGDKIWVHHYEPESKRQSMEWKHTQSPCKKKLKTQPSARKLLLSVLGLKAKYWNIIRRGAQQ